MKHLLITISDTLSNLYGKRVANRVTLQLTEGETMGTFKARGITYGWNLTGTNLTIEAMEE